MAASASGASGLYCRREVAAAILGISVGGLDLAMQRGELEGLYTRVGRSVRFHLPALSLRAAGLGSPQALGEFVKAAGITTVDELIVFLGSNGEAT